MISQDKDRQINHGFGITNIMLSLLKKSGENDSVRQRKVILDDSRQFKKRLDFDKTKTRQRQRQDKPSISVWLFSPVHHGVSNFYRQSLYRKLSRKDQDRMLEWRQDEAWQDKTRQRKGDDNNDKEKYKTRQRRLDQADETSERTRALLFPPPPPLSNPGRERFVVWKNLLHTQSNPWFVVRPSHPILVLKEKLSPPHSVTGNI